MSKKQKTEQEKVQEEEKKILAKVNRRHREMDPEKQSLKTLRQADRRNMKRLKRAQEEVDRVMGRPIAPPEKSEEGG